MKKIILIVLAVSVLLGIIFWQAVLPSKGPLEKSGPAKLTFWGLWEDEAVFRPVLEAYQSSHPDVTIKYVKQSPLNYRTRLQTQLQAGQGPDIFFIHNSWVPMFWGNLVYAPDSLWKIAEFNKDFYPVARETLVYQNRIYAAPLEIDGLAMYVNEDILKGVGVEVPKTWQEFVEVVRKVTVKDQQGQIQTAGAALGTTNNVDYWPEIIATLFFQQPQGDLTSPANSDGAEVLQFYTSFVTDPRNKSWDVNLPSSSQMFSQGKLAFYFAPIRKVKTFKEENPNLSLKVVAVPQLPGKNVSVGGFWAAGVSSRSTSSTQAWEFLKFLSTAPSLQLLYEAEVQRGQLGRPFPRTDMAGLLANDPLLGTFITQAPHYRSWYLNSSTQDNGINDETIKIYDTAINKVLQGGDALASLQDASKSLQPLLSQYTSSLPKSKR